MWALIIEESEVKHSQCHPSPLQGEKHAHCHSDSTLLPSSDLQLVPPMAESMYKSKDKGLSLGKFMVVSLLGHEAE